jgi:PHD/YefM family antitoxin component YafN of YafNO toxin-antitoxin module
MENKMVQYAQNELLSITDFTKGISSVIKNVKNEVFEKVGILKNNKLEAVLISTTEYEKLKHYEQLMEELENEELLKIAKERSKTPLSDYVSFEDMAKRLDVDLKNI